MSYFGNYNPDLLEFMPLSARRVLEIGCGEGALAAAYRARNPKAHYTAVEVHGAAADAAEARVDLLLRDDFETMAVSVLGDELFDLIVMGDVLEHMRAPEAVIARLRGLLAPGGVIALSVPNVAHWSALYHLFNDQWPALDDGLFDRTHLRFFTWSSLRALLSGGGFRMLKAKERKFLLDRARADTWLGPLADFAQRMGIDRGQFMDRASTLQYVVVAERSDAPPRPSVRLVTTAYAPRMMDARARLPATFLGSVPHLMVSYGEMEITLPRLPPDAPRVLVMQRARFDTEAEVLAVIGKVLAKGWLIVAEIDDHPELMTSANDATTTAATLRSISHCHAVQTSTPALAEVLRGYVPEVATFANCAFTLDPLPEPAHSPVRIFFGAFNREDFSAQVARAIAPILRAHPDVTVEVVHDRPFFDALPTNAKRFHPMMDYDAYLALMATCDIVLSPLEGRPHELFKSDIKYVEAASRGAVMIASAAVYGDTIVDGVTGLLAPTLADWPSALERLLAEPGLRRVIAQAAWADVRDQRMFADQANARRDWYVDLWRRRDALRADLLARCPKLVTASA